MKSGWLETHKEAPTDYPPVERPYCHVLELYGTLPSRVTSDPRCTERNVQMRRTFRRAMASVPPPPAVRGGEPRVPSPA